MPSLPGTGDEPDARPGTGCDRHYLVAPDHGARLIPRRLAVMLLLSAAVYGCGFRLAGTAQLPPDLARIYLETRDFDGRQRDALLRRLEWSGASVVIEPASGHARLSVRLLALPDQRLITSASSGKTVDRLIRGLEYSLWSTDGQLLDGPRRLSVEKDLTLDDDNLLASSDERQSAIETLEATLYDRLVIQLQSLQ